jgi:hypothetical protein
MNLSLNLNMNQNMNNMSMNTHAHALKELYAEILQEQFQELKNRIGRI